MGSLRRTLESMTLTEKEKVYRALFICTANSCRSVIGEGILNKLGREKWVGYSAGSHPSGKVHPGALSILAKKGHSTEGVHSKSWEYEALKDIEFDLVITVCDNAAKETCPYYPGRGVKIHWGLPDPAQCDEVAFEKTYVAMTERVNKLLALDLTKLSNKELKEEGDKIGRESSCGC